MYRVFSNGTVTDWFDVGSAMSRYGRPLYVSSSKYGGVRGIAFHPRFERNGLFYISAMEDSPSNPEDFKYMSPPRPSFISSGDSVVLEFRYSHFKQRVLQSSHRTVVRIALPMIQNTVGQIAFQGQFLLIGHGEGISYTAAAGNGPINDELGTVIRINPRRNGGKAYSIPADNPFIGNSRWLDELYAVGFHNPHTICVSDRYGVFVSDSGEDNVDEINIVKPEGNYGWADREGTFVRRQRMRGIVAGVAPLPDDDARHKFTYPNVQVGRYGTRGETFVGQALAGACPVENSSPLNGVFLYSNYPTDGVLYYSWLNSMVRATVSGPPGSLTQARTLRAKIYFDHDGDVTTAPVVLNDLRAVVRMDTHPTTIRADVRFGRGSMGELYWSSQANGRIYLITSTMPRTPSLGRSGSSSTRDIGEDLGDYFIDD